MRRSVSTPFANATLDSSRMMCTTLAQHRSSLSATSGTVHADYTESKTFAPSTNVPSNCFDDHTKREAYCRGSPLPASLVSPPAAVKEEIDPTAFMDESLHSTLSRRDSWLKHHRDSLHLQHYRELPPFMSDEFGFHQLHPQHAHDDDDYNSAWTSRQLLRNSLRSGELDNELRDMLAELEVSFFANGSPAAAGPATAAATAAAAAASSTIERSFSDSPAPNTSERYNAFSSNFITPTNTKDMNGTKLDDSVRSTLTETSTTLGPFFPTPDSPTLGESMRSDASDSFVSLGYAPQSLPPPLASQPGTSARKPAASKSTKASSRKRAPTASAAGTKSKKQKVTKASSKSKKAKPAKTVKGPSTSAKKPSQAGHTDSRATRDHSDEDDEYNSVDGSVLLQMSRLLSSMHQSNVSRDVIMTHYCSSNARRSSSSTNTTANTSQSESSRSSHPSITVNNKSLEASHSKHHHNHTSMESYYTLGDYFCSAEYSAVQANRQALQRMMSHCLDHSSSHGMDESVSSRSNNMHESKPCAAVSTKEGAQEA